VFRDGIYRNDRPEAVSIVRFRLTYGSPERLNPRIGCGWASWRPLPENRQNGADSPARVVWQTK